MRYFGTTFSLTLAGLRLRIRIDLDEEPQEHVAVAHHVEVARRSKEPANS
jgi:hypothetical protein